jgi:hypothetical protein
LWRHYYQNTQGIIYVVDSNDRERIDEAALELQKLLREDELREAVVLVLANKQVCCSVPSIAHSPSTPTAFPLSCYDYMSLPNAFNPCLSISYSYEPVFGRYYRT